MATRDLYDFGESPPLGHVPRRMHAATIRQSRYGDPIGAFGFEVVDVPPMGPRQVTLQVMASGINYNGVWAALGTPIDVIAIRQKQGAPEDFHIAGSEAAGVVWAVGSEVRDLKPGDPVVVSGMQWDEHAADIRLGGDPIASPSASVWGYEDNYGCFAQFTVVDDYQCFPKPPALSWEAAACYMQNGATAYRQLFGWPPNTVKPGDPVLIWGGAGGLGSMAIQLTRHFGGLPIAVVSDDAKREFCMALGAAGVINRNEFDHWGRLPDWKDSDNFERWTRGARAFGKKVWEVLGERRNPAIVFEHAGQDTMPTSIFVCASAGMVVICGGTSGYNADVDLRYLWMRMKRLQGSHFANTAQCAAVNRLVAEGFIDPCLSRVFPFAEIGRAHQIMYRNEHPPGNMALLVNAPREGMKESPV